MQTQQDLQVAVQNLTSNANKLGTDLKQTLSDLEAKITAAGTPVDLTNEIAALNAVADTLSSLDASAVAADAPAAS